MPTDLIARNVITTHLLYKCECISVQMHTLIYNLRYISALGSVTSLDQSMKNQLNISVDTFKESRETESRYSQTIAWTLTPTLMLNFQHCGTMKTTNILSV